MKLYVNDKCYNCGEQILYEFTPKFTEENKSVTINGFNHLSIIDTLWEKSEQFCPECNKPLKVRVTSKPTVILGGRKLEKLRLQSIFSLPMEERTEVINYFGNDLASEVRTLYPKYVSEDGKKVNITSFLLDVVKS